jgi:hypothetical protein
MTVSLDHLITVSRHDLVTASPGHGVPGLPDDAATAWRRDVITASHSHAVTQ